MVGDRGQTSTFLAFGHVAYQIKGSDTYCNMVANILPAETPPTPGVKSKRQNSSQGAFQVKGNEICLAYVDGGFNILFL